MRNAVHTSLSTPSHDRLIIGVLLAVLLTLFNCPASLAQQFDHDNTRFPLDFTHQRVACDSCHLQNVFAGTPIQCRACHNNSARIRASAPSPTHIRHTGECEFCHLSGSWENVGRVDHYAVIGTCQSCHNGFTATGKHPGHVQSSEVCDNCHRTNSWANAVFDHSNISTNCQNCHNGTRATGKPADHLLSNSTCDDCHNTLAWTPAQVDHISVIGSCSSCHNNIIAIGKAADHPATTEECNVCHSTTTFTNPTSPRFRIKKSEAPDLDQLDRPVLHHALSYITVPGKRW
jgi:hypothetical protein